MPYLELAVFVAVTWLTSQVRLSIWVYANLLGMTLDQAREHVLRPGYIAYLWTCRIMSVVIALALAPLMYFRREDLTPYFASAALIMLLVVWGYLYWRLSKRS